MNKITATINDRDYTLSIREWSKITGHSAPSILYRSRQSHFTPAQVIGLDKIDKSSLMTSVMSSFIDSERDKAICEMYKNSTQQKIADTYGLSRQRINQIISRNGLTHFDGATYKKADKEKDRLALIRKANSLKILKTYGCTRSEVNRIRDVNKSYIKNYNIQRKNALTRNIEWKLSLVDWVYIWELSGNYKSRGRCLGEYVMARFGDIGAYELDNIEIITCTRNIVDGYKNRKSLL